MENVKILKYILKLHKRRCKTDNIYHDEIIETLTSAKAFYTADIQSLQHLIVFSIKIQQIYMNKTMKK